MVLDRVFDRDDFLVGRLDFSQECIKRRRLAGTRGAGVEDHAVWARNFMFDAGSELTLHAELFEGGCYFGRIEEAHDERLAIGVGKHARADLDVRTLELDRKSSVLCLGGDIELEPREE